MGVFGPGYFLPSGEDRGPVAGPCVELPEPATDRLFSLGVRGRADIVCCLLAGGRMSSSFSVAAVGTGFVARGLWTKIKGTRAASSPRIPSFRSALWRHHRTAGILMTATANTSCQRQAGNEPFLLSLSCDFGSL